MTTRRILTCFVKQLKSLIPLARSYQPENGIKGLEFLDSIVPDYIFLGINVPMMGCWEVMKLIRARRRFDQIPVFMLSTTTNRSEIEQYIRLGATGCIVKPCSFQELCDMMKNLVNDK